MKEITKTYKVFEFSELSKEAQQKVLTDLYDINTEYDWWWGEYDDFDSQLEAVGIKAEQTDKKVGSYYSRFYFDLDRSDYLYINKAVVVDQEKLLRASGVTDENYIKKAVENDSLYIGTERMGGGYAYNYVDDQSGELSEEVVDKVQEFVKGLLDKFKKQLKDEYEYLTSEDCIKDTIEGNEYTFLENGEMFNE